MDLANNIKKIRVEKGMLQKQIAQELGLKPAHYNKIEKGYIEPSVVILNKIALLFGITVDQIINLENEIPQEIIFEDKIASEQLRLISELNDKDQTIIMSLIETMLTKQKFQNFFQENSK